MLLQEVGTHCRESRTDPTGRRVVLVETGDGIAFGFQQQGVGRPGDSGIDRIAQECISEKRRGNVDDIQLRVVDSRLLRHQVERNLGAGSRRGADLPGLADVLVGLDVRLGIDDQAFTGGVVRFPEDELQRNVLGQRERQREARRDDIEAFALQSGEQRGAGLEVEEIWLESDLLEQAQIARDEDGHMIRGRNAVVEFQRRSGGFGLCDSQAARQGSRAGDARKNASRVHCSFLECLGINGQARLRRLRLHSARRRPARAPAA